jgi:hypothetical protein
METVEIRLQQMLQTRRAGLLIGTSAGKQKGANTDQRSNQAAHLSKGAAGFY